MKRATIFAALPLACSASQAFVCPAALAANRPVLGDVSGSTTAIAPHRRAFKARNQRQRRRGRQLEASLGGAGAPSVVGAVVSSASFVLTWSPTAVVAVVGVLFGASVVNALQGGVRGDLGSTPDKILGVPADEATADHVSKLGALRGSCVVRHAQERVQPPRVCILLLSMKFQLFSLELLSFSTPHRLPGLAAPGLSGVAAFNGQWCSARARLRCQ